MLHIVALFAALTSLSAYILPSPNEGRISQCCTERSRSCCEKMVRQIPLDWDDMIRCAPDLDSSAICLEKQIHNKSAWERNVPKCCSLFEHESVDSKECKLHCLTQMYKVHLSVDERRELAKECQIVHKAEGIRECDRGGAQQYGQCFDNCVNIMYVKRHDEDFRPNEHCPWLGKPAYGKHCDLD